jgi:hypothetical protein
MKVRPKPMLQAAMVVSAALVAASARPAHTDERTFSRFTDDVYQGPEGSEAGPQIPFQPRVPKGGPTKIKGARDRRSIARFVRTQESGILACREVGSDVDVHGDVELHLVVEPSGLPKSVEVELDTVHDPEIVECVVSRARRWRLSRAYGSAEFSQSFHFRNVTR